MMKLILSLLAVLLLCAQESHQETTCQSHKRNAQGARALMQWDIKCDSNGNYEPLQCTVNTPKWCTCYNKEEPITSPSRSTKQCDCPLAKDEATKNSASECDTPKCEKNGKFAKKQCCGSPQKCRCVDPETGRKVSEPTTDANLRC